MKCALKDQVPQRSTDENNDGMGFVFYNFEPGEKDEAEWISLLQKTVLFYVACVRCRTVLAVACVRLWVFLSSIVPFGIHSVVDQLVLERKPTFKEVSKSTLWAITMEHKAKSLFRHATVFRFDAFSSSPVASPHAGPFQRPQRHSQQLQLGWVVRGILLWVPEWSQWLQGKWNCCLCPWRFFSFQIQATFLLCVLWHE